MAIRNCKLFILITLLLVCCNGSKGSRTLLDVKKCKTTSYPSDCPDNAQCSQENDDFNSGKSTNPSIEGVCTCIEKYEFNREYLIDAEYCRLNKKDNNDGKNSTLSFMTTSTSTTTTTTTTSVNNKLPRTEAATAAAASSSSSADGTKSSQIINNVAPSSHHILGGIFISICVVLVFVIGIIGFRKLQLRQRWRNLLMPSARGGGIIGGGGGVGGIVGNSRQRRGRPLYEDVMLSNDTDDPPLI